ncbi:MAG TPA: cyclase, partial [Fibrobacteres bacterium]|nr:cyclase [Fibrobacterota bacterium]
MQEQNSMENSEDGVSMSAEEEEYYAQPVEAEDELDDDSEFDDEGEGEG